MPKLKMTPEEACLISRLDQAAARVLEIEPVAAMLIDTLTTGPRKPYVTLADDSLGVLCICAMYGIVAARDKRRELLSDAIEELATQEADQTESDLS